MRLALLLLLAFPCAAATPRWVGTWATAPISTENTTGTFATETTLRQTVHVSLGGVRARIVFTNEFGTGPLAIGAAQASLGTAGAPVTFGGQPGAMIPPGAIIVSDPVGLKLPALADLTITLVLPAQSVHTFTRHSAAFSTSYEAPGNQLTAAKLAGAHTFTSWLFLRSVEVESAADTGAIVAFGDSITDGAHSTVDANARWPDELARRLQASHAAASLGVLNEGIGGNRLLHDGNGPNALARFDRDVLSQADVRYVILLEGINDIGHTSTSGTAPEDITSAQLIFAMQQIVTRAHEHGIRVIGATLTPYQGAGYASAEGESIREAVNSFIRAPGNFDGTIDFDRLTQDPAHPLALNPVYDCGDHLHPSDGGYKAMGDAIDLKLFAR